MTLNVLFDQASEPCTYDEALQSEPLGYKIPNWFELVEFFEKGWLVKYEKDFYLYVWTSSYDFDQFGVPYHFIFNLASGKLACDYADKRFRACYILE